MVACRVNGSKCFVDNALFLSRAFQTNWPTHYFFAVSHLRMKHIGPFEKTNLPVVTHKFPHITVTHPTPNGGKMPYYFDFDL